MASLQWIGKQAVVGHHREVPYHLLRGDPALSVGEDGGAGEAYRGVGSGNLLVQGDNLLALKALLPYYAGRVKCIYIDPPYNTGNEGWVYNDNTNSPEIRQWIGKVVGKEGETLDRHDRWLCMMYPRLALLKEFLTEDGVLFASIDDVEVDSLRFLLDEHFGRANRVGTIVWKNATDNNPTNIVPEHEYVLCYAKKKAAIPAEWKAQTSVAQQRLVEIGDDFVSRITDTDERQAEYTKWFRKHKASLWPFEDYKFIDDGGIYTGMRSVHNPGKEGYRYDVLHPRTGKPCTEPMMGYRFPKETMTDLLAKDRIIFGDDESKLIELKVYAKDYRAKLSSVFELDGRKGTNEIKAVFPESKRAFNFPKPTELIEELLAFTTKAGDIVLDSFAGSGTTGHAIMKLNKADGGSRRFVLVEMDPTIAEPLTSQRLRRVSEGLTSDGKQEEGLGGGFRYVTLGEPLFDERGRLRDAVKFADLAAHVFFTETGEPIPKKVDGKRSPLIGACRGTAYYLLFNGVLGDKRPDGGNVLTGDVLAELPKHPSSGPDGRGPRVVFGEACRLGAARLKREGVTFRQIPYQIKVS